jgi:sigma-B regulation protein RsbQ
MLPVLDSASVLRRNHVQVYGPEDAPPLMLVHGFGCDQTMWRFVVPDLSRDHRVVTLDYVGSGRSDPGAYDAERYGSLRGYARDVIEVLEALGLRGVGFVGHSVSSMVGVLASIEAPHLFAHLTLVGPSPRYIDDPPYRGGFSRQDIEGLLGLMDRNFMGWVNLLAPTIARGADHPAVAAELSQSFCSTDPTFLRRFAEVTFLADNRADLPRVPVPALVLQCSDDAIAPEEVGLYCAREIPRATYRKLRATGHCPHLSDPEETIGVLREYLAAAG